MLTSGSFTVNDLNDLLFDSSQTPKLAYPTMQNTLNDDIDALLNQYGQADLSGANPFMFAVPHGAPSFGGLPGAKNHGPDMQALSTLFPSIVNSAVHNLPSAMGQSPEMSTPFLDSCTSTPFTPATTFTPCLNAFQASPYFSPHIENDQGADDFRVANYLEFDAVCATASAAATPWAEPLTVFNDHPNPQLPDNSERVPSADGVDASSDFLFPPLSPALDQPTAPVSGGADLADVSMFDFMDEFLGLDANVLAGASEMHLMTNVPEPQVAQVTATATVSMKRKRLENESDEGNKAKRFECDICHAKFNRRFNLKTHLKTHNKRRVKDFVCSLCPKSFDRKHDRDRHIATVHRGERSYVCTGCASAFSRKDALTRHLIQKHGHVAAP